MALLKSMKKQRTQNILEYLHNNKSSGLDSMGEKMMHITDLGGHSGCKILLCETDDNNVFVRKISSSHKYNDRLRVQAKKQKKFKSKQVKAPAILNQGETEEGLFFFDMEYISGITLAEYIKTIEIGKVRNLVETLIDDVASMERNDINIDTEAVFQEKIASLKKQLLPLSNHVVNEALILLESHLWNGIAQTSCHGDLTLENIIVKDNQLYLIDFLDSFYDSWILDIGTLLQDVQTLWSYRFEEDININTLIRLIVFRDILLDYIRDKNEEMVLEVYYSLLLKLIRIFPYTKDERTYKFLTEKTNTIIDLIKQEMKR